MRLSLLPTVLVLVELDACLRGEHLRDQLEVHRFEDAGLKSFGKVCEFNHQLTIIIRIILCVILCHRISEPLHCNRVKYLFVLFHKAVSLWHLGELHYNLGVGLFHISVFMTKVQSV